MTERKTREQFLEEGEAMDHEAPLNSRWLHGKTETVYEVVGYCFIEATAEPAVLYAKFDTVRPEPIWARPAAEFFDGRFVRLEGEIE